MAADQMLGLEQDESLQIVLLSSDMVKLHYLGLQGEQMVLALLVPGGVCGEIAVLNQQGLRSEDVGSLNPLQPGACAHVHLRRCCPTNRGWRWH